MAPGGGMGPGGGMNGGANGRGMNGGMGPGGGWARRRHERRCNGRGMGGGANGRGMGDDRPACPGAWRQSRLLPNGVAGVAGTETERVLDGLPGLNPQKRPPASAAPLSPVNLIRLARTLTTCPSQSASAPTPSQKTGNCNRSVLWPETFRLISPHAASLPSWRCTQCPQPGNGERRHGRLTSTYR